MAFETRVTVFPDIPVQPNGGGGFQLTSFQDLLHLEITLPGLDPAWHHTLVDISIAPDRNSAELTMHSSPRVHKQLDRGLQVVSWLPQAHIKAFTPDGTELATSKQPAPLQLGEHVEVDGERYRVIGPHTDEEMWPHRDPVAGACQGGIDWQHVTLAPDPAPDPVPVRAETQELGGRHVNAGTPARHPRA